jgi:glycosyltransferase involved in cell wall biosynthesis
MRIGISLLDLQPNKSGGIETYCRDLISGLQRVDKKNQYFILLNARNRGTLEVTAKNFTVAYCDSRTFLHKSLNKLKIKDYTIEKIIRNNIERLNLELIHFPLQTIQDYLLSIEVKKIVSIMDIQQEYFPEFFTKADLQNRKKMYLASCEAADEIVAISDYTNKTIIEKFHISKGKVTTVHLNYNEDLFNRAVQPATLPFEPFFYYPAATWPHKNHIKLIVAFAKFHNENKDYHLVLSGIQKQKSGEISKKIKKLKLDSHIHMLGYLEIKNLPRVFKQAFALIYPSLFEGFGIPVIEAMASGCPVIASNTTSVPEVAGNAALYFDPSSTVDIARAMKEIVRNDTMREQLIISGYRQANKFTKAKMVESTLQVYRKVAKM